MTIKIEIGNHANETQQIRSLQRWRSGNYYHHHGVRVETTNGHKFQFFNRQSSGFFKLYFQLCICWYLLEQSSPFVSGHKKSEWQNSLGKSTFAFLAFFNSIYNRMDREKLYGEVPVIAYGLVLLCCAIAYFILQAIIIKSHDDEFALRKVIGTDTKGKISIVFYLLGIAFAFFNAWIALLYAIVAVMWLIPDKRIEKNL